jgi:hypothetical protein
MYAYYAFMALDLANRRVEEADRARLAALVRHGQPERVGILRRAIARGAFAIARAADDGHVRQELAVR